MPLTSKGKKIMSAMKKQYGADKGERVFYASRNKGRIKGVEKAKHRQEGGPVESDENYDYDMKAFRRDNPDAKMGPGQHYPDTYKKPNHPTFSDESIYHGKGGAEGGHWNKESGGSYSFTPGKTNLEHFSPSQLQDYFKKVEPGNKLNLPARARGGPVDESEGRTGGMSTIIEQIREDPSKGPERIEQGIPVRPGTRTWPYGHVISSRARGGSAGRGAYLVGERGPELFVPTGKGAIVPNREVRRLGAKYAKKKV
jgi:hypothetical protein